METKIFNSLYEKYGQFVLNKEETAKELRVSVATVDRMRKEGQLKSKMVRGQVFFGIDEIARYLEVA